MIKGKTGIKNDRACDREGGEAVKKVIWWWEKGGEVIHREQEWKRRKH